MPCAARGHEGVEQAVVVAELPKELRGAPGRVEGLAASRINAEPRDGEPEPRHQSRRHLIAQLLPERQAALEALGQLDRGVPDPQRIARQADGEFFAVGGR